MIDIHAHVLPLRYVAFLKELGITLPQLPPPPAGAPAMLPLAPWTDSAADMQERLRLMDEAGVAEQVLSPTFAPYLESKADAAKAAALLNDELAALVRTAPDRLRALASLPLPHIDAALIELARSLDDLGMAGVTLQCFCGDRSMADPAFEPVFAELDRRGAIVFLHPCINGLCSRFVTDWKLAGSLGPPLEDMVVAVHFIISAIPSRYANLRIVIPHLGGGLAMLLARLDNQLPGSMVLAERPSSTARRMWYDSCCHGSEAALHAAVDAFGPDRIVPGSDYPFLTLHETYRETLGFLSQSRLPAHVVQQITTDNIKELLGPNT